MNELIQNLQAQLGPVGSSALGHALIGLAILIVGLFVVRIIAGMIRRLLGRIDLLNRTAADGSKVDLVAPIASLVRAVLTIFVLMAVLQHFGLTDVLVPLQDLANEFLDAVPNIIGAGVIGYAGWVIAKLVSELVGVALGKQLVIWPVGFGLMELADRVPWLFETLKWASAAYIIWLAWKVANLRLNLGGAPRAPGSAAGLIVHPLNPKAWAMIVAGFTGFVTPGSDPLIATATIGGVLLATQAVLHPIWTLAGDRIARTLAGTRAEPYLMYTLAALTVASVLFVLFGGGT